MHWTYLLPIRVSGWQRVSLGFWFYPGFLFLRDELYPFMDWALFLWWDLCGLLSVLLPCRCRNTAKAQTKCKLVELIRTTKLCMNVRYQLNVNSLAANGCTAMETRVAQTVTLTDPWAVDGVPVTSLQQLMALLSGWVLSGASVGLWRRFNRKLWRLVQLSLSGSQIWACLRPWWRFRTALLLSSCLSWVECGSL